MGGEKERILLRYLCRVCGCFFINDSCRYMSVVYLKISEEARLLVRMPKLLTYLVEMPAFDGSVDILSVIPSFFHQYIHGLLIIATHPDDHLLLYHY